MVCFHFHLDFDLDLKRLTTHGWLFLANFSYTEDQDIVCYLSLKVINWNKGKHKSDMLISNYLFRIIAPDGQDQSAWDYSLNQAVHGICDLPIPTRDPSKCVKANLIVP